MWALQFYMSMCCIRIPQNGCPHNQKPIAKLTETACYNRISCCCCCYSCCWWLLAPLITSVASASARWRGRHEQLRQAGRCLQRCNRCPCRPVCLSVVGTRHSPSISHSCINDCRPVIALWPSVTSSANVENRRFTVAFHFICQLITSVIAVPSVTEIHSLLSAESYLEFNCC